MQLVMNFSTDQAEAFLFITSPAINLTSISSSDS